MLGILFGKYLIDKILPQMVNVCQKELQGQASDVTALKCPFSFNLQILY